MPSPADADKFKDLRLHSPVFWKLGKGHGHLRALLIDLPEKLSGIEDIKRHRRRATAELLGAPARPWRPLSTDLEGLMSVYPVAWGPTRVTSGHNIPAWRAAHADLCESCTTTQPDPTCCHAKLINMLEFGWSPAWLYTPDAFVPRVSPPKLEHKTTLDDTITDGIRRGIISRRSSTPRTSCGTFVVDKRKFDAAAKVWDLDWSTPPPVYQTQLKHRTVFNFSAPCPVNDAAVKWPVRFPQLSYYLANLTPDSWMATEDVKHAYQTLPLANDGVARDRLSFRQHDPMTGSPAYFSHHTGPWGFSPTGSAFMCIPAALRGILRSRGCSADFYVDDAVLSGSSETECQRQVDIFNATCKELGIELNAKSQPPRQLQRLLGFMIDIRNQRITLAPERLLQIRELATRCLTNKTCPRTWLRRLAGIVTWASMAIPGSKAHTVALHAAGRRDHLNRVTVTELMREDLVWWRDLAANPARHGTRVFLKQEDVAWATLISDAGAHALGAHTATDFAWRRMALEEQSFSSHARELLAVEMAVDQLGHDFNNRIVVIGVDNRGTCSAINSGRAGTADGNSISIIRRISDMCFERNIELLALWTRRTATCLADAIADCTSMDAARVCFHCAMSCHSTPFNAATNTTRNTEDGRRSDQCVGPRHQHEASVRVGGQEIRASVHKDWTRTVASDGGDDDLLAHG